MFKIPGYEQFMTTIGKLNFFRWALETKILDYIEAHEDEIRAGYNSYLKETMQNQKRNKNQSSSSSSSSSDMGLEIQMDPSSEKEVPLKLEQNKTRTTRRRTKQTPSSLNKLQVYSMPVELDFN
jgi:hypothetical protein